MNLAQHIKEHKIIGVETGGGGGGSVQEVYSNATPTPTAIGGIPANTTFNAKTNKEMWDALLYPYQAPSFASFGINGQPTLLEVGDSIAPNKVFNWSINNSNNLNTNSISIFDITKSETLASNISNSGSFTSSIIAITKIVPSSHTFRIVGMSSKSVQIQRDFSVSWQWKKYYGENILDSLLESNIESLRVGVLSNSFSGTYSFSAGGYKYICYPSSLGMATTFKDQSTNLDVAFLPVSTISITNSFGQTTNYNIHRTTNILGSAINIVVS